MLLTKVLCTPAPKDKFLGTLQEEERRTGIRDFLPLPGREDSLSHGHDIPDVTLDYDGDIQDVTFAYDGDIKDVTLDYDGYIPDVTLAYEGDIWMSQSPLPMIVTSHVSLAYDSDL